MEGTIGEIRLFAGNFSPRTWTYCSGQLLNVASNTALFAIIGAVYGGNGTSTFGIPDLRGRVAIGSGAGPGLTPRALGQTGGSATTTLLVNQLPPHTHAISGGGNIPISGNVYAAMNVNDSNTASLPSPTGNYLGVDTQGSGTYSTTPSSPTMNLNPNAITVNTSQLKANIPPLTIANSGLGQAYNNLKPFLGLAYIICVQGIFPPRN